MICMHHLCFLHLTITYSWMVVAMFPPTSYEGILAKFTYSCHFINNQALLLSGVFHFTTLVTGVAKLLMAVEFKIEMPSCHLRL